MTKTDYDCLKRLSDEELNTFFIQVKNECDERKKKKKEKIVKNIWTKIDEIKILLKEYNLELYNSDFDKIYLEDIYDIG